MTIEVTSAVLAALESAARAAHPQEACGLLLGSGDCIRSARPAANVHPEPRIRFEIDPQALIDAHRAMRNGGPLLMGYYHSHPIGSARPSATDRALAARDGMVWAIIGREETTFWRAGDDGLTSLPYRVVRA